MAEDRRTRLPPPARLKVEEAATLLDQSLVAGRSAMSLLTSNPAGAALALAQAQDLKHQAIRKLHWACSGVPSVQERKAASATNTDRFGTVERL